MKKIDFIPQLPAVNTPDIYEGEQTDGRYHSYGKYTYADGTVLEGEWRENEFQREDPAERETSPCGDTE